MKRINIIFLPILLTVLLINTSWAQKKSKSNQWTAENKEILLIPSLANQGYLSFTFDDGGFYVEIEPLFWQKALHREKLALVKAAMQSARFLNKEKNMKLRTVMFFDMTTHEELAHGFVSGINPGKIEILK